MPPLLLALLLIADPLPTVETSAAPVTVETPAAPITVETPAAPATVAPPAAPATVEATAAQVTARLLGPEVAAAVGVLGTGYTMQNTHWLDLHIAPAITGRYLFGGFTIDGGVLLAIPLSRDTTGLSFTAQLLVGWTGKRWNVSAGGLMQWSNLAQPAIQWLPRLRASYSFGVLGATLGLFDQFGLVPAHLSADLRWRGARYSLGWVVPIGLITGADLPLTGRVGLRINAFGFKLAQTEIAMLTLGATFDGAAR